MECWTGLAGFFPLKLTIHDLYIQLKSRFRYVKQNLTLSVRPVLSKYLESSVYKIDEFETDVHNWGKMKEENNNK